MKFLIPEDELGVFADQGGVPRVDSLFVADVFDKQHFHVLRDIAKITQSKSGLSETFIASNFESSTYCDATGRKLPRYLLTRDGFGFSCRRQIISVSIGNSCRADRSDRTHCSISLKRRM